jgi:hypothetical protein
MMNVPHAREQMVCFVKRHPEQFYCVFYDIEQS